jgi:hypothetical protein
MTALFGTPTSTTPTRPRVILPGATGTRASARSSFRIAARAGRHPRRQQRLRRLQHRHRVLHRRPGRDRRRDLAHRVSDQRLVSNDCARGTREKTSRILRVRQVGACSGRRTCRAEPARRQVACKRDHAAATTFGAASIGNCRSQETI